MGVSIMQCDYWVTWLRSKVNKRPHYVRQQGWAAAALRTLAGDSALERFTHISFANKIPLPFSTWHMVGALRRHNVQISICNCTNKYLHLVLEWMCNLWYHSKRIAPLNQTLSSLLNKAGKSNINTLQMIMWYFIPAAYCMYESNHCSFRFSL